MGHGAEGRSAESKDTYSTAVVAAARLCVSSILLESPFNPRSSLVLVRPGELCAVSTPVPIVCTDSMFVSI